MLSNLGLADEKAALVEAYTSGRTTHSSDMTAAECAALLADLRKAAGAPMGTAEQLTRPRVDNHNDMERIVTDRMRKKLLGLGYTMGYDAPRNSQQHGLKPQTVNAQNVDAFCRSKHCCVPKGLNDLNKQELAKVITQFEKIGTKFLKEL